MNIFFPLFLTSFFIICYSSSKAQTYTNACYVQSTGQIWESTGGCGFYIIGCDSYGDFTKITKTTTTNCTPCGGSVNNGKKVTINVTPCPLDNYVWASILLISVFAYKNRGMFLI